MALPDELRDEAIEKYGRKFLFIYPNREHTVEDLWSGSTGSGKRLPGYHGICSACLCGYDVDFPPPDLDEQAAHREITPKQFLDARYQQFECPACGAMLERRKGWYGKRGIKDRFYLQAWEVHSPDHVTLHEAIIALEDWDDFTETGGARSERVYDLRTTELTPGHSETWKWNGVKPLRVSNVCGPYESAGCSITFFSGQPMTQRACYMGIEKLSGTFLRYHLAALEKARRVGLSEYAPYIIRMNEEPMTELLFKAGFYELTRERADKSSPCHGTRHMDFTVRSPKKFFRGLKKNNADQKMKQLMKIVYPANVTQSSLEAAARRFLTNPSDRPEDLRFIAEAGNKLSLFMAVWNMLPSFPSHRISAYIEIQSNEYHHSVSYYRDYLEMAQKAGAPLNEQRTAFPENLRAAHDEMVERVQVIMNASADKKFRERSKKLIAAGYEYERGGIMAIVPKKASEIIIEGKNLHHCVGNYVDRVKDGKSVIIFLRHKNGESWFTLEVDPVTRSFRQCYGEHNRTTGIFKDEYADRYVPEVGKFLYHYKRHLMWAKEHKKEMKKLCRKTA